MTEGAQLRRIGEITIDLRTGELEKNRRKLRLQEQPLQVLAALLEHPGEVVTRDELRQRVWTANTFVDFNNGLNIAVVKLRQALGDDASRPRFIETLPRRGYRFVGPVAGVDDDIPVPPPSTENPERFSEPPLEIPRRSRRMAVLTAAAAAVLLVFGIAAAQFVGSNAGANPAISLRPSAAVLGFRNLSADPTEDWLSTALSEMLSTELAAGDGLRTIPGESVARARIDLGLTDADSYAAGTLSRIYKNLGADYVVVGSYLHTSGAPVRLDLRLQNARTGKTIAALAETGSIQTLPDVVTRVGFALRRKLNVAAFAQAETNRARDAMPQQADTARLYAEGLVLLRRFDASGARTLLGQVLAADPGFALAHAAMARSWSQSGYGERAREEAQKAWQLSGNLPRNDRLAIEGDYRMSGAEWDKAIWLFDHLRQLAPDDLDFGLRMASAQVKAGKGKEALVTLDRLSRLPAPLRDDPAIDLVRSLAAEQAGDLNLAQSAAGKGAAAAQARGSRMLVAESEGQQCRMLRMTGHLDDARQSCERARQIYVAAGDRRGAADITASLAAIRADEGDLTAARQLYESALSIEREIGNEGGVIWVLNGLADVLWSQGDLAGAQHHYEQAFEAARQTASRPDQADALDGIAVTLLLAGDLSRARHTFEQALDLFRAMGDKSGVGNVLGNLGETLYFQGDLARAAELLQTAAGVNREAGNISATADVLAFAGRVEQAKGDMAAAARRYEDSLKAWQQMGSPGYVARHRLRFADLALETGHPEQAVNIIQEALPVLEEQKQKTGELEGRTLLARGLVASGRVNDARREIARAGTMAKTEQGLMSRLAYETAAAQMLTASGQRRDAQEAIRRLQPLVQDARAAAFTEYHLQMRLALAVAEIRAGSGGVGARDLKSVERDARERGYKMIAQRAAAIAAPPGVGQ